MKITKDMYGNFQIDDESMTGAEDSMLHEFLKSLFDVHEKNVRRGKSEGAGYRGNDELHIILHRSNPSKGELGYLEPHFMYQVLPSKQEIDVVAELTGDCTCGLCEQCSLHIGKQIQRTL